MRESAVEAPLTAALAAGLSDQAFRSMEESAKAELAAQAAPAAVTEGIRLTRRGHLRYDGTREQLKLSPQGSGVGVC